MDNMVKCYLCEAKFDNDFVGRKVGDNLFICDPCYATTSRDTSLDVSNADCDIKSGLEDY
jgi:hypothetical protein